MSANNELDPEIYFSNLKKIAYMLSLKNEIIPNAIDVSTESHCFDRMIVIDQGQGEFRLFVRCYNNGEDITSEDVDDFRRELDNKYVDKGLIISLSEYTKEAEINAANNNILLLFGLIKTESNFSHRNQICFYWEGECMESKNRMYGENWTKFAQELMSVPVPVMAYVR